MKNKKFYIVSCAILWLLGMLFAINKCLAEQPNYTARIFLNVKPGSLVIGTTDSSGALINMVGNMWNTVTWRFDTWAFWVDDHNWSTKYWTTISATDLVSGSGRISAENIKLKMWDGPILLSSWDVNTGLMINPQLSWFVPINNPVRYFYNNQANWILWRYWDNPEISIKIPNNLSFGCTVIHPCEFKWTITYTLYEAW
jgi:hypothetical protein